MWKDGVRAERGGESRLTCLRTERGVVQKARVAISNEVSGREFEIRNNRKDKNGGTRELRRVGNPMMEASTTAAEQEWQKVQARLKEATSKIESGHSHKDEIAGAFANLGKNNNEEKRKSKGGLQECGVLDEGEGLNSVIHTYTDGWTQAGSKVETSNLFYDGGC